MKPLAAVGVCALLLSAFAFRHRAVPQKPEEPWKLGYWIWAGDRPVPAPDKPQILYVQIQGNQWPGGLPPADSYVAVRRIEPSQQLTSELAQHIAQDYAALTQHASRAGNLEALQIDYDCPTPRLDAYARFLTELHDALPPKAHLSITALLDWFTPNTDIKNVLATVDEFVPQFYDTAPTRTASGIAEPIDVQHWAPIFNSLKTPYRIGISSFGRIARRRFEGPGKWSVQFFRDASPLDFAGRRELKRTVTSTAAGETVVRYEVIAAMPDREQVQVGDIIEITFPTESSVRKAYAAVRAFGGYCAGVLFFRWPNRSETLALTADEIQRILAGDSLSSPIQLETNEGACVERRCLDLVLHPGRALSAADRDVEIRMDHPMDLFLPEGPLQSMPVGTNRVRVRVPAYSGTASIYLGRVFAESPLKLEVEQR